MQSNFYSQKLDNSIFVVADPQFFCPYVFEYIKERKSFGWVELLNHEIIKNWNDIIHHNDVVLVLGDFINGIVKTDECIAKLNELSRNLNGQKILLRGNHDNLDSAHYYDSGWRGVIDFPLVIINNQIEWLNVPSKYCSCIIKDIDNTRVMFSHFPVLDEEDSDPRYLLEKAYLKQLFEKHECDINIHGHTHDRSLDSNISINACLEQTAFKPIRYKELLKQLSSTERKIA